MINLLLSNSHYGPYAQAIANNQVPERFPGPLIPDRYLTVHPLLPPVNWNNEIRVFQRRHGMFAIIDKQWTAQLANHLKDHRVLEVMAGRGWLAKAMREHGIDWHATDDHSMFPTTVTDVEKLDAVKSVRTYRNQADVLVMSWPPYQDPICERVVDEWPADKPIIYVGEWDGCTGTERLRDLLTVDWSINIDMPTYPGFHDRVHWCQKQAIPVGEPT